MPEDLHVVFQYKDKLRSAQVLVSLQDDLKVIFCSLNDAGLIEQFGKDVDFQTDLENVKQTRIFNTELLELQTCILESVKKEADFLLQKSLLKSQCSDKKGSN